MKQKRKWLVTVQGYDEYYSLSSVVIVSKVIKLNEDKTPIDWFLSKPKVYYKSEFTPCALLGFWKIK